MFSIDSWLGRLSSGAVSLPFSRLELVSAVGACKEGEEKRGSN